MLQVRATSAASARVDAGSVVTSVFTVKNAGVDTMRALPTIAAPHGWSVVMGATPVTLAPGAE